MTPNKAPPIDGLYAWLEPDWIRVETISGSEDGDIVGLLINGSMDFYRARFHKDGYYETQKRV